MARKKTKRRPVYKKNYRRKHSPITDMVGGLVSVGIGVQAIKLLK